MISGVTVVDRGGIVEGAVVDMSGTDIEITVDLGLGEGEAVAWGCDLTAGYVRIIRVKPVGGALDIKGVVGRMMLSQIQLASNN